MHHPVRRPLAWALALAAGLLLVACQPDAPIDPLDVEVEFSFQVTNPEELTGPVYGVLLQPFEEGAFLRAQVDPAPNLDGLLNAFVAADLAADGEVAGTLTAPVTVPRINENLGVGIGTKVRTPPLWRVFFPPAECPLTATNAVEAALAPVQELMLWDGEAVDEAGYPLPDGRLWLGNQTYEEADGVQTWTYEGYLLVVSRAAWSATSDGPCTFESEWGDAFLVDVDLAIDVGWQFLHFRSVERYDGMTSDYEDEVRSLTLAEVADLGAIGTVEARPTVVDLSVDGGPSLPRAFERLFR